MLGRTLGRTLAQRAAAAAILALAGSTIGCSGGDSTGPRTPQPSALAAHAGNDQRTLAGTAVAVAPAVLVTDRAGAPLAGVPVTFVVTAGGGTITGAQATSDAAGVATLGGWTLGATPGENTLTASGPAGLAPVVFRAVAVDLCGVLQPYVLASSAAGTLATTDCRLSFGAYLDSYAVSLAAGSSVRFTMTSTAVDALLTLVTTDSTPVAVNDDAVQTSTDASFRVLGAPGAYILGATSFERNEVGAYTITSAVVPSDVARCEEVFVVPGVSTTQAVQATDCQSTPDAAGARFYSDEFIVWMVAGRSYTIDLTSAAFDAFLLLFGPDGAVAAQNDNLAVGGRDARIVFTPTRSGFHFIDAGPAVRGATGAYTLSVR